MPEFNLSQTVSWRCGCHVFNRTVTLPFYPGIGTTIYCAENTGEPIFVSGVEYDMDSQTTTLVMSEIEMGNRSGYISALLAFTPAWTIELGDEIEPGYTIADYYEDTRHEVHRRDK